MGDENPNAFDRDHAVFPDIVSDRDVYIGGKLWTARGDVLTKEQVAFAYSREGRRVIGFEFPNPVPLEPPLGYVPAKPIHEQIRDMVMNELSLAAAAAGEETLEESEDFDVEGEDQYDPYSPWEMEYEPTRPWFTSIEVEAAERRALALRQPAQKPADEPPAEPPPPPSDGPKPSEKPAKADKPGKES